MFAKHYAANSIDSVLLLSTMQQGNDVKLRSALLGEGF